MNVFQKDMVVESTEKQIIDITAEVNALVEEARVNTGICSLFIQHTSASLIISENADPNVKRDLEAFMAKLVPEDQALYCHNQEGPDDMPAHIRSVLTQSAITIPIKNKQLALGKWQEIALWEHRAARHKRVIVITIIGA